MRAVIKTASGSGNIILQDIPIPTPKIGEVLIAVKAISVCGTDVELWRGKYVVNTPVVIGHEFSGEIVHLGPGDNQWKVGDRVVAENTFGACWVCGLCRTGNPHICSNKRAYGSDSNGAMAEYICLPHIALHRIPDNVSFEQASLTEPLAVVNRGVLERGEVKPESTVVILGPGPIGLLATQVCRLAGANKIILAGTFKDAHLRLPLGLRLGATSVVNVESDDLRSVVAEATGGEGADLVIEASGSVRAIQEAVYLAGRGKIVAAIGLAGGPVQLDWDLAVFKEIDIRFSKSSSYMSWHRALSMIAGGRIDVDAMITHRFAMNDWFQAIQVAETGEAVKALLIP